MQKSPGAEIAFTGLDKPAISDWGNSIILIAVACLLAAAPCRADCLPPPPGIVAWWPGGGNASDIIGAHHGALQNGTGFATGTVGQAFSFDGIDDRVQIPDSPLLKPARVSVEAWVKFAVLDTPGASSVGLQYIVFKQNSRVSNFEGYSLAKLRPAGVDRFIFEMTSADPINVRVDSTTVVSAGVYYHVVGTYDGSFVRLYVNGVLEAEKPHTRPIDYGTSPVWFGSSGTSYEGHFSGQMDEVAIFNRALASNEVAAIYAAGSAGMCNPPPTALHHYTFDGASVVDSIGTANGTLMGGAALAAGKLNLDGNDDFVQFGEKLIPTSGSFSVAFFARQLSRQTGYTEMISQGFSGGPGFYVGHDPARHIRVSDVWLDTGVAFPDDLLFHHFAIAADATDTRLYIDGALVGVTGPISLPAAGTDTRLGTQFGTAQEFFHGQMDDLWIFSGKLTPIEVIGLITKESPNLVRIPPGTFTMGSASDEPASAPNETPQHQVTLTRGFWMNQYEVTQGEFQSLMGSNPSHFIGDTNRPVERVSWNQAAQYCSLLTQSERAAGRLPAGYVYRLPTEAEWEYACRAGTTNRFSFGDNPADLGNYGWHIGNSGCQFATDPQCLTTGSTQPVGQKLPNPWGLCDMHGNVGEFVSDWSGNYSAGSVTNPVGPATGVNKLFRAPAWDFGDIYTGSATRWDYPPTAADDSIGFRVVLAAEECLPAPSGLAAWWRGEGNARDALGRLNGTFFDRVRFAPGLVGQAFSFVATNHVEIPDAPELNPTAALAVEAWVYVTGGQGSSRDICGKDGETFDRQYFLSAASNNRFRAHLGVPGGLRFFDGATPVQSNRWYHLAMAYDGTALKLYVNGALDGSLAVTGPVTPTTQPFRIGGGAPAGNNQLFFSGLIDEVSLYNRALSAAEVSALYAVGTVGKCHDADVLPGPPAYAADFESSAGPEWSSTNRSTTPLGARRFLGEFGNQTVRLTLPNLPAHTVARVSFDLFVIRSWDGNSSSVGPDIWSWTVVTPSSSYALHRTTFNNISGTQSHPGSFTPGQASPNYLPYVGAAEGRTLGYTFVGSLMDSIYKLSSWFAHTNGALQLDFSASGLQALADESWGLDNVMVEVFNLGNNDLASLAFAPVPPLFFGNPVAAQARLFANYLSVTNVDVTGVASWSSGDTNVFTVNAAGQLLARNAGTASLIGAYLNQSATTAVTVLAPVTLRQTPLATPYQGGAPVGVPLFADFPGASNVNVTAFGGVTRNSSDPTVATIDATGLMTPLKAGIVTLTATYGGLTHQTTLAVVLAPGAAPFSGTNLVVVRVGDGTQTLTATGNSAFLDQFTSAGEYVNSVAVPDTGATGVVMSGSNFVEGFLTRSPDRRFLSLAVYGTNVSSGVNVSTSTNIPRVVATFDASSTYKREVVSSNDYPGVAWRSAATDGTNNFWGAGSANGTLYLGNALPRSVVQNAKGNTRVVQVFNGDLYMSSASSDSDGLTGIYKFNGLPKTNFRLPAALIFTNTFSTNSLQGITDFSVSPSGTIIYFADDRAPGGIEGGIQRWDFNSGSGNWANSYNLTNGIGNFGASHLEVDWTGPNPILYATTKEASRNRLVKVTDSGPSSAFALLATAGTNQVFRGVKLGPVVGRPVILSQPSGQAAFIGSTAKFTVAANGTEPITYHWRKDRVALNLPSSPSLVLANVQPSDAGNYSVIVSNAAGIVTSSNAVLTVTIPSGADVVSEFSASSEGWVVVDLLDTFGAGPYTNINAGPYTPTFLPTSGNPGGCIQMTDPSGNTFFFQAPAKFLGDIRSSYGRTLSFDFREAVPVPGGWYEEADVILTGGNGLVLATGIPIVIPTVWTDFSVGLIENEWHVGSLTGRTPTQAEFLGVLANLKTLWIRGEVYYGTDVVLLDNVRLGRPGSPPIALRQSAPNRVFAGATLSVPLFADFPGSSNVNVTAFVGVTRTSSDPSVATISNGGTVTALKSGSVTLTAIYGGLTNQIALEVIDVPGINASLIAYEGFDYANGTDLSGQSGGYGWSNAWTTPVVGDLVVSNGTAGSLSYTDALGNTLLGSGNAFFYSGSAIASGDSRSFRDFPVVRGDDNTTTWISCLGQRIGPTTNLTSNPYPRGATPFSLYAGATEKLAIGNSSGAPSNTWALIPMGQGANIRSSSNSFSQLSLVVVRIDHKPGNDDAYLFINPALGSEPLLASAAAQSLGGFDLSFNRIRPFVGGNDVANASPYAELNVDEIRVGQTFASVTPSAPGGSGVATVVYNQDFEGFVGAEWSTNTVSVTPVGGRRFLGEFGNQTVRLSLTNLPAHTLARVSFDVFVLRSWDGNSTSDGGPDLWRLNLANGTQVFRTTFNNIYPSLGSLVSAFAHSIGQAYPGTYATTATSPVFPAHTGASEVNALGFTWQASSWPFAVPMDSVYRLSRLITDTNSSLLLDFTASGLEVLANESWGLDNVRVELFNNGSGTLQSLTFLPLPSLYPGRPIVTPATLIGNFTGGITLNLSQASAIIYTSSNTNVFSVSAVGEISPRGVGAADLIASYLGLSATTRVTVLAPVALRQSVATTLNAGDFPVTATLFADFPGQTNLNLTSFAGVTRSSSDPTVAPITSGGVITPRKPGITTLTAAYAGLTNQISLSVVLPPGYLAGALVHRYSFSESANLTNVSDLVGGANGRVVNLSSGATTNNFTGAGQLNLSGGAGGNASAAYVNLPNGLVSDRQSVTLEGWVTWYGPANSFWQRIFDYGRNLAVNAAGDFVEDQFNGTGASYAFLTPLGGAGRVRFGIRQSTGTETPVLDAGTAMSVSNQTHFAVVYDPPSGVSRLYLNGQRVATAAAILRLNGLDDRNVWLGRSQFSADPFFNGLYNEFRIYDGALLDDDVQASFAAGPNSFTGVVASPPNDNFQDATALSGAVASGIGSNVGATKETNELDHAGNPGGKSVWWTWTAPSDGSVTVNTLGSSFDTVLAVYTGTSVSNLLVVASNDDFVGQTSQVTFSGVAGMVYRIAVDGHDGTNGRIVLNLQASVPPAISVNPRSINVAAGYNAAFTASANGVGPFMYQWFNGSTPIAGATGATLTVTNVQAYNAGTGHVTVTGFYGPANSAEAVLTVEAPYDISTFAGSGTAGSGDGIGAAAQFNGPHDVALDGAGNVYVAENNSHVIRRISTNGVVTTLAGLAGAAGSVDATGSAARFNAPRGLTVDNAGNVYVADSLNHTIRKITPAGAVSTLVGSAGLAGSADGNGNGARFNQPRDVALDSAGNLIVADPNNHVIRKVAPDGVVTTIAGRAGIAGFMDGTNTGALFFSPGSVVLDTSGNIFVADLNNHTIRKLVPSGANWVVTTLAGLAGNPGARDGIGSAARFRNPSGLGTDGAGNLYVAGFNTHAIHRVSPDGVVTTLAGFPDTAGNLDGAGRVARLNALRGITVDPSGTIFVADFSNHKIRKGVPSAGILIEPSPTSLTLSEEGTANLSVQASGRGPFSYQWFFNGGVLNGATQSVLHLSRLTSAQAGQYQVRVRTLDGLEETFSTPVTMEVRKLSWQFAGTPGLSLGVALSDVWSRGPHEAYALGSRLRSVKADIPDTYLYRWDGTNWTQQSAFPGNYPGRVFGTGASELWVTLNRCSLGAAAGCGLDQGGKIYRSQDGGLNWVEQLLPPEANRRALGTISGTSNNVQVVAESGLILRFNGVGWSTVFSDPVELVNAHTLLGATEGYYITCWGWGQWDGSAWKFNGRQFDFCDASATWALRDGNGLHWYAVGNNNFANGIRIWQFDSATQSFGGKTNFVFGEGDASDLGSATGIWGSAADDVYVIGSLASAPGGVRAGRIYHYDGSAWSRVTEFGEIPSPTGIHGTAHDDVWIALSDGRLLHRNNRVGTNEPPVITTPPQAQSVVVNRTGVFSVAARGTPPLRYQWYLGGATALPGATSPLLVLPSVQLSNGGSYRVVVTNNFGSVTSGPVALNVIVPPTFSQQPRSTNALLGSLVTLTVVAPGATEFQWRKNGANIAGATNSTYLISNIQFNDGGSYTVVVANDAGAVTSDIAEVIVRPKEIPGAADYFSNRVSILLTGAPPVIVTGFNTNATKEAGEPDHADRIGGRSVWFSWNAPASGIATFNTVGSTFDTVLGVYTGSVVSNLVEIAANDDDDSNDPNIATNRFFASEVRFNVTAGTDYQIVLDGFGGESGYFVLSGNFEPTTERLPLITAQPESQVEQLGSNVTFTVAVQGSNLVYQWYLNGSVVPGATNNSLPRPNISAVDVGDYSVRVRNSGTSRYADSRQATLEITSHPEQGIVFQDKVDRLVRGTGPLGRPSNLENLATTSQGDFTGFYSVAAGTVGYHLGNNVLGRTDLREVNHGNLIGTASLYLSFQTTNAGRLVVDTKGSGIDNVFAIYRDNANYDVLNNGLIGFATNAANAQTANSVQVTNGPGIGRFLVAADGVKGRRGAIQINWSFGTPPQPANAPGPPPVQRLNPGGSFTFRVGDPGVTNAAPRPVYRWYRDDLFLTETPAPVLMLTQVGVANSGTYRVAAVNVIGTTTNLLGRLLVTVPINIESGSGRHRNGLFELTMNGTEGDAVVLQATTNLVVWTDVATQLLTGYDQVFVDTTASLFGRRYYRLVPQGSLRQAASPLFIREPGTGPDGGFRFILPPSAEVPLVVEVSTNLQKAWVPIFTNPLNPDASIFTDHATTNAPARFYRLRLPR